MRPEPLLAEKLERGGLRLRPRSPLGRAAAQVLRTPVPSDDQDVRKDAGLRLSRYAAGAAHSSLEVPPSVSDVRMRRS